MHEDRFTNYARGPFQVRRAVGADDTRAYNTLLQSTYTKLGFLEEGVERFLPPEDAIKFVLCNADVVIGIFSLRDIPANTHPFVEYLPALATPNIRALEVTNLVLEKHYRGSIGLPLLLYAAVQYALDTSSDFLVGIARYSALRAFVDAGALPIYHPPLHLLGKSDIADFICYFDLRAPEDRRYIDQRASRLLQQIEILSALRRDFLKPNRCARTAIKAVQNAEDTDLNRLVRHPQFDVEDGV